MELFLDNEKMDVTSLRFESWETIVVNKDGKDVRYTSETGWDVDDGFELRATRREK